MLDQQVSPWLAAVNPRRGFEGCEMRYKRKKNDLIFILSPGPPKQNIRLFAVMIYLKSQLLE